MYHINMSAPEEHVQNTKQSLYGTFPIIKIDILHHHPLCIPPPLPPD